MSFLKIKCFSSFFFFLKIGEADHEGEKISPDEEAEKPDKSVTGGTRTNDKQTENQVQKCDGVSSKVNIEIQYFKHIFWSFFLSS